MSKSFVDTLILAAWWKKAQQSARRTTSQSVPLEQRAILCCSMISFNCCRTSLALRIAFTWMKLRVQKDDEYLCEYGEKEEVIRPIKQ